MTSLKADEKQAIECISGGASVNSRGPVKVYDNPNRSPGMPYYSNLPPILRETDGEDSSPSRGLKTKSLSPVKDTRAVHAVNSQRQINIEIQGE